MPSEGMTLSTPPERQVELLQALIPTLPTCHVCGRIAGEMSSDRGRIIGRKMYGGEEKGHCVFHPSPIDVFMQRDLPYKRVANEIAQSQDVGANP